MEKPQLNFHERQEKVWIVQQTGHASHHNFVGVAVSEDGAGQLPGIDRSKPFISTLVTLFRPALAPIYGGPTLLEALWSEMDSIMERLMTGQESDDRCSRKPNACKTHFNAEPDGIEPLENEPCGHADNGDKYRAQELAWVLAIVSNAYDPSVDAIRAEAVNRWRSKQEAE